MEWAQARKAGADLTARPGWLCAGVFAVGWAVFLFGITQPGALYWDEVNYIPAVRALLHGVIMNREHPPLAKELISLGMLAFGDNPIGWRFMASIAGALALVGVFAWSLALFREVRPALLAAVFTLFNQVLYVNARFGNIDVFNFAFMIWGIAAFTASWRAATPAKGRKLIMLAGACFGLSTACKWIGVVPWIICIGLVLVVRQFQLWRVRFADPHELDWYDRSLWSGIRLNDWLTALGAIPLVLYYLTFLPTYGVISPLDFVQMHIGVFGAMANSHQAPILLSDWTSWAFARHPNYYTFTPWVADAAGNKTAKVVVFLGNPFVIFLGLPAIALCAYGWVRHRRFDAMLITLFYLGLYLCWAAIPRAATFYTYYFPPAMILGVALAYALTQTPLARLPRLANWMAAACGLLFLMFLPISSAAMPATPWTYDHLMWFNEWKWPRPGFCGADPCS